MESSLERCLTFYSFPEEEWISLRTTNAIERVNKEFKRRTKPMEILAGERSAYTVMCFAALKLEQSWKSTPPKRSQPPRPPEIYTGFLTLHRMFLLANSRTSVYDAFKRFKATVINAPAHIRVLPRIDVHMFSGACTITQSEELPTEGKRCIRGGYLGNSTSTRS